MTDSIKDKIAKLLRLAGDKGASEAEATTAMSLAASLAAKAGIDIDSVSLNAEERKVIRGRWREAAEKKWKLHLAYAVTSLYAVNWVKRDKEGTIQFVGRSDLIESAEFTHDWLIEQVERLYKINLPRGLSVSARAEYRRTFKEACSLRIRQRAWDILKQLTNDDAIALESTGHRALVLKESRDHMIAEIRVFLDNLGTATHKPRASLKGSGSDAGRAAGDTVKLQHGVGATGPKMIK